MSRDWDESEHPRHPAGSGKGGEFRSKVSARGYAEALLATARQIVDFNEESGGEGNWDVSLADKIGKLNIALAYGGEMMFDAGQNLLDYLLEGPASGGGYITQDDLPGPPPWQDPERRVEAVVEHLPDWAKRHKILGKRPEKDWADRVLGDPYPNNDKGTAALRERVLGTEPVYLSELSGGQTAQTTRMEFLDGTSIVRKAFFGGLDEPSEPDEYWDEELGEWVVDEDDDGLWYDDEQRMQAIAEIKASEVAGAIGAPALTVIADPDGEPNVVYYGYAEGSPPGFSVIEEGSIFESDEAVLIGVLDLLIENDDRQGSNWLVTPEGKPFAIDHGQSFEGHPGRDQRTFDLRPATGPFADRMLSVGWIVIDGQTGKEVPPPPGYDPLTPLPQGYQKKWRQVWHPNRLHPGDIAVMKQRIQALHDRERLTIGENRYMQAMLDGLGKHATGTRRLVR